MFINDVSLCFCVNSSPTAASFSKLRSHDFGFIRIAFSSRDMLSRDNSILVMDNWIDLAVMC